MPNGDALPADVQAALAGDAQADRIFGGLPPSHKREYLKWMLEAKKPEARARRVQGMVTRLMTQKVFPHPNDTE
jgi:uncharacterized protein YdeI (YjbR/CyaY-like superfamily)